MRATCAVNHSTASTVTNITDGITTAGPRMSQRLKSSGMSNRCRQVNSSRDPSRLLGGVRREYEVTTIVRNVGEYIPVHLNLSKTAVITSKLVTLWLANAWS
jgi:hypothetical protein